MTTSTFLSLHDYDAIAAAVMETERGRWFLAEFARRNRVADTAAVLDALSALEARLLERLAPQPADKTRSEPRLETVEPPPAIAATPIRPTPPKAWTPGLLETLSAEERAILFA